MAGSGRVAATAAVLVVLVAAAAAPAPAEGAVTECRQVMSYLISCLGYATGRAASPPTECCSGVKGLNSAAATAADRRTACNCLKQQTGAIGTIRPDLVAGIPSKCGVNIPYPISPSTDCSRVH